MATNIAELRQKSKLPAKQAGIGTVKAFFDSQKAAIAAVLPKHLTAERIGKIALGAVRGNPKLLECTVESLFGAVIKCAELGLEPNTPLGHVYMIPFRTKRGNEWVMDVQVIVGYKGYIDLARRSGQIVSIAAHEVCEHDDFEFAYGLDEKLHHVPARSHRGAVIYYYAVAKLVGGGHAFEVMTVEDVEAIRDKSQGWQQAIKYAKKTNDGAIIECNSPWFNHPVEMGRKTAVRRLMKYLPLSIQMATASQIDSVAETDESQHFESVLEGEWSMDTETQEQVETPNTAETGELPDVPEQYRDLAIALTDAAQEGADALKALWNKECKGDAAKALKPHYEALLRQCEATQ